MTALSFDRFTLDMRRGACPALSAPMMTGDGLLARVPLTGAIAPPQLAELCRLAAKHGNGVLDISARGNLQVRGLTKTSAPVLEADIRALGLPLREGLAVEVPPLAGMDQSEIADPRPIAEGIEEGARDIQGLAPKMSVVVDGGGQLRLSSLLADIRLVAVGIDGDIHWKLLLGGTEATGRVFDVLRETEAAATTLGLLRRLAALGQRARGKDLATSSPSLCSGLSRASTHAESREASQMLGTSPSMTEEAAALSPPFSVIALCDDLHAVGIGPAFGQATAADLIALCDEASRLGVSSVKPAFDHSLLFFGKKTACHALQTFARKTGFIVSPADPRSHVAVCPGRPSCHSASFATHAVAISAAAECAGLFDGSFRLHVSGCAKGCALPQPAALSLTGTAAGLSFIADGKAADRPFASVTFADTNAALRRIADLVRAERQGDENSAACLARLGPERLSAAVTSGRP